MLKIRLQRVGKKGKAHFRVVLLEHTRRPKGSFQELLGSYDPHVKKLDVKKERIEYWKSNGAQVSPTVNNLLINHKVLTGEKMPSWKPKKKAAAEQTPQPAA